MGSDKKIDVYEALIKRIMYRNLQGYKRLGAMGGASLGSGVGATVGLINTAGKHRRGELDQLNTKEKALEYLKGMAGKAGIGMGVGALAGAGIGELGKRMTVRKAFRGKKGDSYKELFDEYRKSPADFHSSTADIREVMRDLKKEPVSNIIENTKNVLKNILTKKSAEQFNMNKQIKEYFIVKTSELSLASVKEAASPVFNNIDSKEMNRGTANPNHPTGLRRSGALYGGAHGAMLGGGLGALKGLLMPGKRVDPETGKSVDNDRLSSALEGAVGGGLIGGGLGAVGGGHMGSMMRNASKGSRGRVSANMTDFKKFHQLVPGYIKQLLKRKG